MSTPTAADGPLPGKRTIGIGELYQPDREPAGKASIHRCKECGCEISELMRPHAQYCGHSCRQKSYLKRKRQVQP